MTCTSQSSRLNHPDYISATVQTVKFLILKPSTLPILIQIFPSIFAPYLRIPLACVPPLTLSTLCPYPLRSYISHAHVRKKTYHLSSLFYLASYIVLHLTNRVYSLQKYRFRYKYHQFYISVPRQQF